MALLAAALFAIFQGRQWLLRWRAEWLMADMHRIRLYQTTWPEAQEFMRRWGAWGHWEGSCTPEDCRYVVELGDWSWWGRADRGPNSLFVRALSHDRYNLYELLGGRPFAIHASFAVHKGTVCREMAGIMVTAAIPRLKPADDFPLTLMVGTSSRSALHPERKGHWILGSEDQLSEHPFFKAGRPGGCEVNCEDVDVAYSTRTAPEEIERLTTFNFRCLTPNPFQPCEDLADLLPAEKPWDVYADNRPNYQPPVPKTSAPKACDIPVWALARDYGTALAVEVVSNGVGHGYGESYELDRARVVEVIKGKPRWPAAADVSVMPFSGEFSNPPYEAAEHLTVGAAYVVFPGEDFYGLPKKFEDPNLIQTNRCAVQADTPQTREELRKGFAMNDDYQDSRE
jgi:hypothetical protein